MEFLSKQASNAQALYILGDLFEYWAGDEELDDTYYSPVIAAMRAATYRGCKLYVMHGNRDFLLGEGFARASGAELLPDPLLTDLHGRKALLTHGDMLCTEDVDYQEFRSMVRNPQWQCNFLSLPLAERKARIEKLRSRSEQEKSYKDKAIMDVNAEAVADFMRRHDYPPLLIHGHTHRPDCHRINLDGRICERIVLSDWGERGSYLKCNATGHEVVEIG
jgi:UDP-2,3-diacylglucosamine hydrolase